MTVLIDCDNCVHLAKQCDSCIISYITTQTQNDNMQVQLTIEECNSINKLARAGLVNPLKYDDGKVFSYGW